MCEVIGHAHQRALSRRTLLKGAAAAAATAPFVAATASPARATPKFVGGRDRRTRLVLLGTAAGPIWWEGTDRRGTSSAVVVEDSVYLVDCGDGWGTRYREADLGPSGFQRGLEALKGVFLTHLHSDHVIDYPKLPVLGLFNGLPNAGSPVQVYGPGDRGSLPPVFGNRPEPEVINPENPTPGIADTTEYLYQAFASDLNDRLRDNNVPSPRTLVEVNEIELPAGVVEGANEDPAPPMDPVLVHEDDRVRVTATLVNHPPTFPTFGFRFDTDDGSVVFSGDTSPTENLLRLAEGADVLVHEVIDKQWVESSFGEPPYEPREEAIINHLITSHTTIEQVGTVAEDAGVKTLVLNHLAPADNPVSRWRDARSGFSGRFVVGEDLLVVGVGSRRASRYPAEVGTTA